MKKRLLVTLLSFSALSLFAQAGSSCATAITTQVGAYRVDTMYSGAATLALFSPYPDRAIWYKYTPTTDGLMTISTCNGGADTRLLLYTGTCAQLTAAGHSDDVCQHDTTTDAFAAKLVKPVKANTTYYIEFDNAWDTWPFTFSVSLAAYTPTLTQTCATATAAIVGNNRVDSLFGYATRGDANRANWYKYTPTRNGRISITTCGDPIDTRLWVYRGACNTLTLLADSDDDCISRIGDTLAVSISNLAVTVGTTYFFEFDDAWENEAFIFNLTFDAANRAEDLALGNAVQMMPNPTRDVLNLDFNFEKTTDLNVHILNTVGQVVFSKKIAAILRGGETLDLSHLQTGVYVVELNDGVGKARKKLIVGK